MLRNLIKKYPDLASTRFRIHKELKNFHSGERMKKVADSYTGFIGLDLVTSLDKKYSDLADSKISGYVWTGPRLMLAEFDVHAGTFLTPIYGILSGLNHVFI